MVRLAPESGSVPIAVTYLDVAETEHLLDGHEELISAPMRINVVSPVSIYGGADNDRIETGLCSRKTSKSRYYSPYLI